jgi:RHH-type proline utilization regulon transcriptional repressor/proline dehydrogenase/delta 1-pyrroline-5-carboxylate dehydrogenase
VAQRNSAIDVGSVERLTRRIGREIFERAESLSPSVFSQEYWQQFGLDWLTKDEDLKLRVFRFVEAMPALDSPHKIARHLRERVLREDNGHQPLPEIIRFALGYHKDSSIRGELIARAAQWGIQQAARRFICGSTPGEAIQSVRALRRSGMAFTLDLLGETTENNATAREHQEMYVRLITELGKAAGDWLANPILDRAPWGPISRVNVSIKLTSIVAHIDEMEQGEGVKAAMDRLRPILRAAKLQQAFINVDMEHYAIKDLTLDVFRLILSEPEFAAWPDCGIVIQAYLRDSERDLASLIDWTRGRGVPITVRLVKGAYWDSESADARAANREPPVYGEKWQSDTSFERLSRMMLDSADVIRPALGSHNVRSIASALAYERVLGLPPRTLELQMLTGMGEPLQRALVAMDQRVRIYAPFGDLLPGMAYLIRRLIENTANESFLRQSFGGSAAVEELLEVPAKAATGLR